MFLVHAQNAVRYMFRQKIKEIETISMKFLLQIELKSNERLYFSTVNRLESLLDENLNLKVNSA